MMKKNEEMEVKANEQLKKVEYTISRSMYEWFYVGRWDRDFIVGVGI